MKDKIKILDNYLEYLGIKKTWISILATRIKNSNNEKLYYILNTKEFLGHIILDNDLIDTLTIGQISLLYEYSLSFNNQDKKEQLGQFFTPDDVSQFVAKKTNCFPQNKIWLDLCSGIGNLSFYLLKEQKDPETFLKNNLYLLDVDGLALLIARTLFTIYFQNNDNQLFNNIRNRFITTDFLLNYYEVPNFDYIITNPPYGYMDGSVYNIYGSSIKRKNKYAVILKNILVLKTKGFVSITPISFIYSKNYIDLRDLLVKRMNDIRIYCFDNIPDRIFDSFKFGSKNTNKVNSTRIAITIAQHKEEIKETTLKITPLLRWKREQRNILFNNIDSFLEETPVDKNIFYKQYKELKDLFNEAMAYSKKLKDLLCDKPTQYKLIVPTTPRYFISATKRDIKRSSYKVLYFNNKEDYDYAYLLLNSSYIYWWWKICDNGMKLSNDCLFSLPIPNEYKKNYNLVKKLEKSEKNNLVTKNNAGKENENIKHELSLIDEINKFLFPKYATNLLKLHNNTDV